MAPRCLLILGLAVFAIPCVAVKQLVSEGFIERPMVEDEGRSLGDHHGAISLESCELFCDTTDGCKSFTFKPQQGKLEAWCHLKDKCVDEKTPEKKFSVDVFTTFYKQYIKMAWTERALVAAEGNPVGNFPRLSLNQCKQKCHATPMCKSFSFAKDWCMLKDKCVAADDAIARHGHVDDTKTYYLPCATSGSATWHQRSLVVVEGRKLAEDISTQRECEIKCDSNPLCNSFSFKQDSGTCRLFDKEVTEDDLGEVQPSAYHTYYKPC